MDIRSLPLQVLDNDHVRVEARMMLDPKTLLGNSHSIDPSQPSYPVPSRSSKSSFLEVPEVCYIDSLIILLDPGTALIFTDLGIETVIPSHNLSGWDRAGP